MRFITHLLLTQCTHAHLSERIAESVELSGQLTRCVSDTVESFGDKRLVKRHHNEVVTRNLLKANNSVVAAIPMSDYCG